MIGIWIQILFAHEPTVRKISMTCLLSHESEFEGGELEIEKEKQSKTCARTSCILCIFY